MRTRKFSVSLILIFLFKCLISKNLVTSNPFSYKKYSVKQKGENKSCGPLLDHLHENNYVDRTNKKDWNNYKIKVKRSGHKRQNGVDGRVSKVAYFLGGFICFFILFFKIIIYIKHGRAVFYFSNVNITESTL